MSDSLTQKIQSAQIRAGEDAVIADLRNKGLMPAEQNRALLKAQALEKLREAEKLMYDYFCACDIGPERTRAHEVYENIRNATRVA